LSVAELVASAPASGLVCFGSCPRVGGCNDTTARSSSSPRRSYISSDVCMRWRATRPKWRRWLESWKSTKTLWRAGAQQGCQTAQVTGRHKK